MKRGHEEKYTYLRIIGQEEKYALPNNPKFDRFSEAVKALTEGDKSELLRVLRLQAATGSSLRQTERPPAKL